ncbi:MAG: hypothetical protein ACXVZV_07740 [Terriglobales bacterium]
MSKLIMAVLAVFLLLPSAFAQESSTQPSADEITGTAPACGGV